MNKKIILSFFLLFVILASPAWTERENEDYTIYIDEVYLNVVFTGDSLDAVLYLSNGFYQKNGGAIFHHFGSGRQITHLWGVRDFRNKMIQYMSKNYTGPKYTATYELHIVPSLPKNLTAISIAMLRKCNLKTGSCDDIPKIYIDSQGGSCPWLPQNSPSDPTIINYNRHASLSDFAQRGYQSPKDYPPPVIIKGCNCKQGLSQYDKSVPDKYFGSNAIKFQDGSYAVSSHVLPEFNGVTYGLDWRYEGEPIDEFNQQHKFTYLVRIPDLKSRPEEGRIYTPRQIHDLLYDTK